MQLLSVSGECYGAAAARRRAVPSPVMDTPTTHAHADQPHDHPSPLPDRLPATAYPRILATGLAMGSADIVPGVSGGTIALVLGIYDRLVGSIRQGTRGLAALLRGRPRDAWRALLAVDWGFLVVLLVGIGTAVVVLAGVLERLLEEQPVLLSAGFLGLVAGSVVVSSVEVRRPSPRVWAIGAASAVATFLLLGLRVGSLEDPAALVLVAGGALAICAMILPGVSGSFLLLLVGLYDAVPPALRVSRAGGQCRWRRPTRRTRHGRPPRSGPVRAEASPRRRARTPRRERR